MSTRSSLARVPAGVAIVGLGLLWGAAFPAIDVVVSRLPALGAAGVRYAVSGCVVLGYARLRGRRLRPATGRELLNVAAVAGLVFVGYQACLFVGTEYVTGAVAAVVVTTSPIVAAAVAVPVLGESRGLPDLLGLGLGVAGVAVLAGPSVGGGSAPLGVGLVFLGAALFGVGSVAIQRFDGDLSMEALQGWAMLVGAAGLFAGGALRGEAVPAVGSLSPIGVGALAYVTLVAGAGGYLLYFRLVRRVGATETTLVAYVEPVGAAIVSALLLGRPVGASTVVGFLVVAAGFTLVSRTAMRRAVAGVRTTAASARTDHEVRGD